MMSFNVKDYLKVYDNFLGLDLCSEIVKEIEHYDWDLHHFYDPISKKDVIHSNELSVAYSYESSLVDEVQNKIWDAVDTYISKDFSYMSDWFNGMVWLHEG